MIRGWKDIQCIHHLLMMGLLSSHSRFFSKKWAAKAFHKPEKQSLQQAEFVSPGHKIQRSSVWWWNSLFDLRITFLHLPLQTRRQPCTTSSKDFARGLKHTAHTSIQYQYRLFMSGSLTHKGPVSAPTEKQPLQLGYTGRRSNSLRSHTPLMLKDIPVNTGLYPQRFLVSRLR